MPSYWYNYRDNKVLEDDDEETIQKKEFNRSITAANKPYFMTYIYPPLKKQNKSYQKSSNQGVTRRFMGYNLYTIQDLETYPHKTEAMKEYLEYYYKLSPVGTNPCIINKICKIFEQTFKGYLSKKYDQPEFDYSILKSVATYSKRDFNLINGIYKEYLRNIENFMQKKKEQKVDIYDLWMERDACAKWFKSECERICPNEDELCNIVIDMLYKTENSKQFVWDVCGDTIINNLLKQSNGRIQYPEKTDEDADFQYCGIGFKMKTQHVEEEIA